MQIALTDKHSSNAFCPSVESLAPDSNVLPHLRKQEGETVSTDEGMQIDRNGGQCANACFPKIETQEPGANATLRSRSQLRKYRSETWETDAGMQTDSSDAQC
jgi:hypothetical protein